MVSSTSFHSLSETCMIVRIGVEMTNQKSALLGLVITVRGVVSSRSPFLLMLMRLSPLHVLHVFCANYPSTISEASNWWILRYLSISALFLLPIHTKKPFKSYSQSLGLIDSSLSSQLDNRQRFEINGQMYSFLFVIIHTPYSMYVVVCTLIGFTDSLVTSAQNPCTFSNITSELIGL